MVHRMSEQLLPNTYCERTQRSGMIMPKNGCRHIVIVIFIYHCVCWTESVYNTVFYVYTIVLAEMFKIVASSYMKVAEVMNALN